MKLFFGPASPYVRKVTVSAIELGLAAKIERLPSAAHPVTRDDNVAPFDPSTGKVPTPVLDDRTAPSDSRVICEYLDAIATGRGCFHRLRPSAFARCASRHWVTAFWMRRSSRATRRPCGRSHSSGSLARRTAAQGCHRRRCRRGGVRQLRVTASTSGPLRIACALGYLDFRFPQLQWRAAHLPRRAGSNA